MILFVRAVYMGNRIGNLFRGRRGDQLFQVRFSRKSMWKDEHPWEVRIIFCYWRMIFHDIVLFTFSRARPMFWKISNNFLPRFKPMDIELKGWGLTMVWSFLQHRRRSIPARERHQTWENNAQSSGAERIHRTTEQDSHRISEIHDAQSNRTTLFMGGSSKYSSLRKKSNGFKYSLDDSTPFEKWLGEKPSMKHLRIFGSHCYVYVPKDQRTKCGM